MENESMTLYKQDHRTEDNLFILKSIHESYAINKRKNIYAAFVDFSKLFDFIGRKFMLYKLLKHGITGNVYNIIKSMYKNPRYCVMVNGKASPYFTSSYGIKQGCSMSPILSNIFQNDLHDIFQGSDPIKMGDIHFNSLSWADDLLLLSTSESGLQSCLNQLQNYCRQWGLTIYTKNTKSMVFSSSRWTPTKMFIGDTPIECVKNFQYLGFHISYNMKLKNLIADREANAMRWQIWYIGPFVHPTMYPSNYRWVCWTNKLLLYYYMGAPDGDCQTLTIWYILKTNPNHKILGQQQGLF